MVINHTKHFDFYFQQDLFPINWFIFSMAFSMYLFTRGEGPLKTTQELFVQAEYFAEEGKKLYKTVRDFASKVLEVPHPVLMCRLKK